MLFRSDPRTYKLIEEYFARAQHHRRSPVTPSRGRIPCLPTPLACAKKKILNNKTPTPTWEALDLQKSKAISYKRRQASYPTSTPLTRPLEDSTRRLSMRRRREKWETELASERSRERSPGEDDEDARLWCVVFLKGRRWKESSWKGRRRRERGCGARGVPRWRQG